MKKRLVDKFVELVEFIASHMRGTTLLLVLLVIGLGAYTGYKYYLYTMHEPEFCLFCHELDTGFKDWQTSKHRNITCQTCHILSIFEKNQLLVAYVIRGEHKTFSQSHGRGKAWDACQNCHSDTFQKDTVNFIKDPRNTQGHARHLTIAGFSCRECHTYQTHSFDTGIEDCLRCHKNKIFKKTSYPNKCTDNCLDCHNYRVKDPTPYHSREACLKCHKSTTEHTAKYKFLCSKCHLPHSQLKPDSGFCLAQCHDTSKLSKRHDANTINCRRCHKAHKRS